MFIFPLLRFVQRFREQPPLPRLQREMKNPKNTPQFWWIQNEDTLSPEEITNTELSTPSTLQSSNGLPRKPIMHQVFLLLS